jgi:hypothetical protein
VQIIIRSLIAVGTWTAYISLIVKIAVMKDDILKTAPVAGRRYVHLTDALCLVACTSQLSGQCMGVIPGHSILVSHPPVGSLA